MPTLAPEPAPSPRADPELSAELEELLALVMAWMGGEAAARPRGLRPGTVVEALGEALIALWEDRLSAAPGTGHSASAAAGLAATLPVGAAALGADLHVRSGNRALFALVERPRGSVLGHPLSEALGVEAAALARAAAEAHALGEAGLPLTLHRSSGPLRAQLQLSPTPDGGMVRCRLGHSRPRTRTRSSAVLGARRPGLGLPAGRRGGRAQRCPPLRAGPRP